MNAHAGRYLAVVITGLVAFSSSLVWYSPLLFGDIWTRFADASVATAPTWKLVVAPLREIVTAAVLAFVIIRVEPRDWKSALLLGFALWVGFYVVQLTGAVIWDNMPWPLGAVHAGDWLMKMLFMTVTLSAWHRRVGV